MTAPDHVPDTTSDTPPSALAAPGRTDATADPADDVTGDAAGGAGLLEAARELAGIAGRRARSPPCPPCSASCSRCARSSTGTR